MLKEKRAIQVSSVLSDHLVNREKRVTEVFPVHQDRMVPKETMVLLVLQVHLVLLVLLDYLVLLVLKEPKGHRVKLDQRERLAHLDLLAHQVLLAMSSILFPSRLPLRVERVGISTPARWSMMQPWTPTTRTTMTAWKKSLVH